MKNIIPFLMAGLLVACGGEQTSKETEETGNKGHAITGQIKGAEAEGQWVKLAVFEGGNERMIDSTVIKNGQFELNTVTTEMREYILFIGQEEMPVVLFLDETDVNVSLKGSYPGFGLDYSVEGSAFSQDIVDYLKFLDGHRDAEFELYANLPQPDAGGAFADGDAEKYDRIMAKLDSISIHKKAYAIDYINAHSSSPVGWVMLREMFPPSGLAAFDTLDYQYFEMVSSGLKEAYPYSDYSSFIDSDLESIRHQIEQMNAPADVAPEIVLNDTNGNPLALSSLRGKVVLLDFWASWCRPCRAENPNVVRMYEKYKDKGFTVYSVSLDNNRDAWLRAIEEDNLSWPNHVSDLKGWQSEGAAIYGVGSIPATFLIDENGVIIGQNLRGMDLERKLQEVLK